jgi:deoxycytidylate deaminase
MDESPLNVGFFRLAREESRKSTHRVQMGAVLSDKRPTSRGFNKIKTHPKFANPSKHLKISIHAEIDCIMKSKSSGDTIWVWREDLEGNPKLARPCSDCMKSLKAFGIKRIYYTVEHFPYWKEEDI